MLKYLPNRISRKLRKAWYWYKHGIDMDMFKGSILPNFSRNKFVNVYKKGNVIDVVCNELRKRSKPGTIRVTPCADNFGFLIEYRDINDKIVWRTGLDYDTLYELGSGGGEEKKSRK